MRRSIGRVVFEKGGRLHIRMMRLILGSFASGCATLVFFVTAVQAKEYEYAISYCSSGTTTVVSQKDEMTILSSDAKGIT